MRGDAEKEVASGVAAVAALSGYRGCAAPGRLDAILGHTREGLFAVRRQSSGRQQCLLSSTA